MRAPFEVFEPAGNETPVIVEIPHSGLEVPAPFIELLCAPARSVGRDADLYVDSLYEDLALGRACSSREPRGMWSISIYSEVDVDADTAEGGRSDLRMHHGLVWRMTSEGEVALGRRLTREELRERVDLVWRPYHRALADAIERKRSKFGLAVVLAAHSMPSIDRRGPTGSPAHPRHRADVVPGTRGRKTADERFIDAVENAAVARGWSVRHDEPYAGGFTTQNYGHPAEGVHVVQMSSHVGSISMRQRSDKTTSFCAFARGAASSSRTWGT